MPSACARFKSDDGGIERGDHIGMRALRIIVPVLDRPDSLPFQGGAGVMGRQTKLIASAHTAVIEAAVAIGAGISAQSITTQ
jgi:hypothetical protein